MPDVTAMQPNHCQILSSYRSGVLTYLTDLALVVMIHIHHIVVNCCYCFCPIAIARFMARIRRHPMSRYHNHIAHLIKSAVCALVPQSDLLQANNTGRPRLLTTGCVSTSKSCSATYTQDELLHADDNERQQTRKIPC